MKRAPVKSAIATLGSKLSDSAKPAVAIPVCGSFQAFLLNHVKVKCQPEEAKLTGRSYKPFTFVGRPAVQWLVNMIDQILGSHTGKPIRDAKLAAAGGAQWGKTVLGQALYAYLLGVEFLNVGFYLPDDDLVQGVVDTKFRPDVVDQIPWFADLLTIGKIVNESGKQVNRKGAMQVTDGHRVASGYFRGCGKIPTTFSMDAQVVDERDDIPEKKAKFLSGRMTASDLRFTFVTGTQRYHGAGQNKEFEEGSQHIGIIRCECGKKINPEEEWPQVCRLAIDGAAKVTDPRLTLEGEFRSADGVSYPYDPEGVFYYACPDCGAKLDMERLEYEAQKPDNIRLHRWSIRVSQIGTPAIDIRQIVADWCLNAIKDPDSMVSFCCDRKAMPKSMNQSLTPAILERARNLESYTLSMAPRGFTRYGGLDTGDRFWFTAREVEAPLIKRLCWLEQISPANARTRVPVLFNTLGLACLFIDIGAERQMTRDLVLDINMLREQPKVSPDHAKGRIGFSNGIAWDGEKKKWSGIKCAAVEFSLKPGEGIRHEIRFTQEGLAYPVIRANRDESIQGVIDELLTADDGLVQVVDGKLRTQPVFRTPQKGPGAPAIIQTFEDHLLAGSKKEIDSDGKTMSFADKIENHLLLADAYARLAETFSSNTGPSRSTGYEAVEIDGHSRIAAARNTVLI
ncbi:MAG: hypothetical protein V2A34_02525 [Lentisphaerota bacterium]